MTGTSTPSSATRRTTSGTAAAASSLLTVTRTICEPALASATTCSAVARASAVSVLVIDCTTTGWADPTGTRPTQLVTVGRRDLKITDICLASSKRTSINEAVDVNLGTSSGSLP